MSLFLAPSRLGLLACALFGLAFPTFAAPAKAPSPSVTSRTQDRVVAVVNTQVIPLSTLQARTRLAIRELGLANPTAAQASALQRRTLLQLVDEELQRQYAAQNGLAPTPAAIAQLQDRLTQQLGGPEGWQSLTQGLTKPAQDRLRAEALWQAIIANAVAPKVQVGTTELDQLIQNLSRNDKAQEYDLSLIIIGQPAPNDTAAQATAQEAKLAEVRQALATAPTAEQFATLARTYSDDASAAAGGALGWVPQGQLAPALEEALKPLAPGQTTAPVRLPDGWYVLRLNEARALPPVSTQLVAQKQLYLLALPQNSGASPTTITAADARLTKATRAARTPSDVLSYFAQKQYTTDFPASQNLGWVELDGLQPAVREVVAATKNASWSAPFTIPGTGNQPARRARIFVADSRQTLPRELTELRTRIAGRLTQTRTEQEARRFMRELRARAFVDIRL